MLKYYRSLCSIPNYSYNLRRPAPKRTEYDKERVEYNALMNQYRSRLVKSYWKDQTKLENEYIDKYLAKEKIQAKKVEQFKRSETVIKTFIATQQYNKQQQKKAEREDRIKKYFLQQDIKRMNRQQILKILNEESKTWFNQQNLEQSLTGSVVLPETVIDETSYYYHLQDQALLMEEAQFEELDKYTDHQKQLEWKNRLAMPLFQRILSLVKYLRQDNVINKVQFEWDTCRAIILQDRSLTDSEIESQLNKIDGCFQTILADQIEHLESSPVLKLQEIHKQLLRLYNLVELWQRYLMIVKLDNSSAKALYDANEESITLFSVQRNVQNQFSQVQPNDVLAEEHLSADEKHTSSDEEIDIDAMMRAQDKKLTQKDGSSKPEQKQSKAAQTIEELLAKADQNYDVKQFDDLYAKDTVSKIFYNPKLEHQKVRNAKSIFEGVDIETLFPAELLNKQMHPLLDFRSTEDIQLQHNKFKDYFKTVKSSNPESKKLNTLVIAEAYKEQLSKIVVPSEYQKLHQDTLQLLDFVAEQHIEEPQFLLELWNYYK